MLIPAYSRDKNASDLKMQALPKSQEIGYQLKMLIPV